MVMGPRRALSLSFSLVLVLTGLRQPGPGRMEGAAGRGGRVPGPKINIRKRSPRSTSYYMKKKFDIRYKQIGIYLMGEYVRDKQKKRSDHAAT